MNDSGGTRPPVASVLLPVFNGQKYLEEAIESVLNQTFTDFDLLLLDDGSTDGSRALMERYAAKDGRCRVYSWPNRGIVATLNAGIGLAMGEYIIRMDSDDICLPHRFEKQIRFLVDHPRCVVVGSRVTWIDPEGMPLRIAGNVASHEEIDAENMKGGQVLHHPSVVMRRDALAASGGYREGFRHAEDLDLFLRLAEIGQLANLPEVLLSYRQHLDSIGHRFPEQQSASVTRAVMEACERRGISAKETMGNLRPEVPRQERWEIHRRWGWWALQAGNLATARKHALRALIRRPLDLETLQLSACVLRGH